MSLGGEAWPTDEDDDEMRRLATEGSYGAVEGRVETLGRRRGLQFTLYDTLHDRPVSCYVSAGNEEMMRDIWAKYAVVKGWIRRDPISGRPLTVRRIEAVDILPEKKEPHEYRQAQGVVNLGGEKAEDIVRRIRDAW